MAVGRALRLVREMERMGRPIEDSSTRPSPVIRSPFTEGQLTAIVWADIFGETLTPVTRADAMAVPAMARARHIICGFGARAPLRAYQGEAEVEAPSWTYRTDQVTMLPPYHRMLWSLDDVLFGGWSLWAVARDAETKVQDAARVPFDWWEFDDDGTIKIDDHEMPYEDVLLIPGPHEGLLAFGAGAIRHAARLLRAAQVAAETPVPNMELHDEGEIQLTQTEQDELIAAWAKARRGENGGVAYTSRGVKAIAHGQNDAHLLIDGRNAAAVDIARTASLPAALLDATLDKGSLTYETAEGRNAQALEYGVQLYLDAIAARLSMDDVVPRGTRIGFDLENMTALDVPGSAPAQED
jgi:hypothetical protein